MTDKETGWDAFSFALAAYLVVRTALWVWAYANVKWGGP